MRVLLLSLLFALLCSCVTGCDEDAVVPIPPGPDPADTTSHSYIWRNDTLGGRLSRVNDVFCLSEDDAWAVGYFYHYDSTGKVDWTKTANAAHWDGRKWTLVRINPTFQGGFSFGEVDAIYCLGLSDIWAGPYHWDGWKWDVYNLTPISRAGGAYKIWGDRTDNVYSVGNNGSIIHWDGQKHTQMGLETPAWNRDIWGWGGTIYIAVTDPDLQSGRRGYLIRMENGRITELVESVSHEQISVWGMNGTWYSGGCGRLFRNSDGNWVPVLSQENCITGIRGTALNDVCIFIGQGEVIHYNGSTFASVLPADPNGIFTHSIATIGHMVLACGHVNSYAIVKRGYRQQVK